MLVILKISDYTHPALGVGKVGIRNEFLMRKSFLSNSSYTTKVNIALSNKSLAKQNILLSYPFRFHQGHRLRMRQYFAQDWRRVVQIRKQKQKTKIKKQQRRMKVNIHERNITPMVNYPVVLGNNNIFLFIFIKYKHSHQEEASHVEILQHYWIFTYVNIGFGLM